MTEGLTPSEKLVAELCQKSFLRLWTHPNPVGKKGKELCDCLIVCGPHVVIISVKECDYVDTGDKTGWERWEKRAIAKSADQIWGAERWLMSVDTFQRKDGRTVSLPPSGDRRFHRISVSLGGKGQVFIKWGDLGNGFVHVCDEVSVGVLFGELDTITDFVAFLDQSERFVASGVSPIFGGGGIEDLVALYISWGHTFELPDELSGTPDSMILMNDLWSGLKESDDHKAMKEDLKESYLWDRLIEHYAADLLTDGMFDFNSRELTDDQSALVAMALQPRGHRANLAEAFAEFLTQGERKIASRAALGDRNTAFVFLLGPSSDREMRVRELALRCLVIRGTMPGVITVVGIATDQPGTSEIGYSSDIVYMHLPEWSEDDAKKVDGIQRDLGYFKNANVVKG
ncbi:hypothetical protein RM530_15960 [Algiphilus sp. W345]|uniref:NERD domain-containing protein n=1 Tax=Banduia mediterranea TaxID=3075609 RepID=A0ABU2WLU1_9GAMM|nr:hypothetical protein [Algiphilus sp. W345]MDT0498844.1 hypothetical protein [Algiphilus sp. W345]